MRCRGTHRAHQAHGEACDHRQHAHGRGGFIRQRHVGTGVAHGAGNEQHKTQERTERKKQITPEARPITALRKNVRIKARLRLLEQPYVRMIP